MPASGGAVRHPDAFHASFDPFGSGKRLKGPSPPATVTRRQPYVKRAALWPQGVQGADRLGTASPWRASAAPSTRARRTQPLGQGALGRSHPVRHSDRGRGGQGTPEQDQPARRPQGGRWAWPRSAPVQASSCAGGTLARRVAAAQHVAPICTSHRYGRHGAPGLSVVHP